MPVEKKRPGRKIPAEDARKGGAKVAVDREHMARIGRKGGAKVSTNREHMSKMAVKAGHARQMMALKRLADIEAMAREGQPASAIAASVGLAKRTVLKIIRRLKRCGTLAGRIS